MSAESQAPVDFRQIEDRVLSLPVEQRLELAHKLWESVEPPPNVDDEEELTSLLRRRAQEIDDGTVQMVDHEDVIRAAREALAKRRCE